MYSAYRVFPDCTHRPAKVKSCEVMWIKDIRERTSIEALEAPQGVLHFPSLHLQSQALNSVSVDPWILDTIPLIFKP